MWSKEIDLFFTWKRAIKRIAQPQHLRMLIRILRVVALHILAIIYPVNVYNLTAFNVHWLGLCYVFVVGYICADFVI